MNIRSNKNKIKIYNIDFMRKLFFLQFFSVFTFSVEAKSIADSSKSVKMFIMNDNRSRPIGFTKNDFWMSDNLNVITFSGDLYFDLIKYRLSKNKKDSIFNNFSIEVAVILSENNKSDTLYTNIFFRDWLIKDVTFATSDDFLRKMFGPLYLGFYLDMRKGEK